MTNEGEYYNLFILTQFYFFIFLHFIKCWTLELITRLLLTTNHENSIDNKFFKNNNTIFINILFKLWFSTTVVAVQPNIHLSIFTCITMSIDFCKLICEFLYLKNHIPYNSITTEAVNVHWNPTYWVLHFNRLWLWIMPEHIWLTCSLTKIFLPHLIRCVIYAAILHVL